MAEPATPPDLASVMRSRQFVALLVLVAILGVVTSVAAWCFLELTHELQQGIYTDLPDALGYDSTPLWLPLPVLALAGLVVAVAITRLPGRGGHEPADGLNPSPTQPIDLPGVILAALATIGLGAVLGPEAPLIALGGGLGLLAADRLRGDPQPEARTVIGAAGTFAAVSFLFGSPLIGAVLLIEASGIGGPRLPLVLLPGLLASGIGSLVSTGLGSWTGVSTADISIPPLPLPHFARPDLVDFLWTVPLAAAVAVAVFAIYRLGKLTQRIVRPRPFATLPLAGLVVAALAIGFAETTDHGLDEVLFSGQDELAPLVSNQADWTLGALALLIGLKGVAYGVSLGSFRGGPTFPAMFLATAGGLMAADLPGFSITPAVAVGIGASVVAALRLPLSAVVLATVLTSQSGLGVGPLIIVGVTVAYLTTLYLPAPPPPAPAPA